MAVVSSDRLSAAVPRTNRARAWRLVGVVLVAALLGFLAGLAGFALGHEARLRPSPWLAVAVLASLIVPIVVHECGHVAAGRVLGFQFKWMTLGPLRITRQHGRLRPGWNRLPQLRGGAVMLLPDGDHDLPRRLAWTIAAGPLASLALAAAAWAAARRPGGDPWILVAVTSLLIGVATSLPTNMGGMRSDGARLLDLWRGGTASARECRMMAIASAMSAGRRPSTWDAAIMQAILAEPAAYPQEVPGLLSVYFWCLDRDAVDEAETVLMRARTAAAVHPPMLRAAVQLEYAWWLAVQGGDLAQAEREYAAAAEAPIMSESTRLRAWAAVLWRRGAHDEARKTVDEALAALATEEMGGATPLLERMTRASIGEACEGAGRTCVSPTRPAPTGRGGREPWQTRP